MNISSTFLMKNDRMHFLLRVKTILSFFPLPLRTVSKINFSKSFWLGLEMMMEINNFEAKVIYIDGQNICSSFVCMRKYFLDKILRRECNADCTLLSMKKKTKGIEMKIINSVGKS